MKGGWWVGLIGVVLAAALAGCATTPADSLSPSSPSLKPTAVSPSPSPVRLSGHGSSAAVRKEPK